MWRHRSGSTSAQVIPGGNGLLVDGTKQFLNNDDLS